MAFLRCSMRRTGRSEWLKIRNQSYSQWVGREELFERERNEKPTFQHWAECALACENVQMEYA
jgi:hypothetical protein